jgi:alpha-ketoglutarate-dependent taurine dioxygenase
MGLFMPLPAYLNDSDVYERWRDEKLNNYPTHSNDISVDVGVPKQPTNHEIEALTQVCRKANMAIYVGPQHLGEDKSIPINLGTSLGLNQIDSPLTTKDDGVSEITVASEGEKSPYIPYTDRALGWHTDGCYNDADHLINGFILHCVRAADEGGINHLLDPEIAYVLLRDEDPELIDGLMLPDALTIPANLKNGKVVRSEQSGPALSIDPKSNGLHMRYTARKSYVVWSDDPRVKAALEFLEQTLNGNSKFVFSVKLEPGSGLVGNNVLHNRTEFKDSLSDEDKRLIYRVYYLDRIANT